MSSIGFGLASAAAFVIFGLPFLKPGGDRRAHLPAETSHGHGSIEIACEKCHTTPYAGVSNDACNACHEAELAAANDTHAESKFADPRYADKTAGLDARACVTCHREHAPDQTKKGGVTAAADFCAKCHGDIAEERPNHAGFKLDGCASTGCHRFHDNRALYSDFMKKHLREPEMLAVARVALRGAGQEKKAAALTAADADAPPELRAKPAHVDDWAATAHAKSGVNCSGCHATKSKSGELQWAARVDHRACEGCHGDETRGFLKGKHGMRTDAGLSPARPTIDARLPMQASAAGRELGCTSCHGAHSFETGFAAVDACEGCHADRHTTSFRASRHFKLWEAERAGKGEPGTGVSCATCHLPREAHGGEVSVKHDQNDNLRPRDKMIRGVCMSCHGLGFSLDALADEDLVQRNFNGRPTVHVESLDLIERRVAGKK